MGGGGHLNKLRRAEGGATHFGVFRGGGGGGHGSAPDIYIY